MDTGVQPLRNESRTVEIVVHVNDALDEDQRNELITALKASDGIADAVFCPLRWHLMLVRYDNETHSSQDVLARISSQNVTAQLIGPV
ncbi:MAG: hypothetical protein ACWGNB_01095 [Thiogranum sp.]|jgi:hypothetical protein